MTTSAISVNQNGPKLYKTSIKCIESVETCIPLWFRGYSHSCSSTIWQELKCRKIGFESGNPFQSYNSDFGGFSLRWFQFVH